MIKEIDLNEDKFSKIKELWKDSKINSFYYNTITNEYFGENETCKFYFNLIGKFHRIDGPAFIYLPPQLFSNFADLYYINHINYKSYNFAFETNHLICGFCYKFCKQRCFI